LVLQQGRVLLLEISKLLGFCRDVDKVFRGVKHSLIVDRETFNKYIMRENGVAAENLISITFLCGYQK